MARHYRLFGICFALLIASGSASLAQAVRDIRVIDASVSPYYFSPTVVGTCTFTAHIEVPLDIPGIVRGQSGAHRQDGSQIILHSVVDLVDGQGNVIREVVGDQVLQPLDRAPGGGQHTIVVTGTATWDGKRSNGVLAPDAIYTFRLSADLRKVEQNPNANPHAQAGQPRITVLARTSTPAQGTVLLDSTPPQVTLTPPSGSDVTDIFSVQFVATYTDNLAGVVPATFHYRWEAGELTDLFTVGAGQAVYRPTQADLPRLLHVVVDGTNNIRCEIADRAGNAGSALIQYHVALSDFGSSGADEEAPNIEVGGGSDQSAVAGRSLPQPIVVRVTSVSNGQPWNAFPIEVRLDPDQGGMVSPIGTPGMLTDANGQLTFRLRTPSIPGHYAARIVVRGWSTNYAEVSFDALAPSVSNVVVGGNYSEVSGSALPSRVDLLVQDAQNHPVSRATVVGQILNGGGQPVADANMSTYGEFLPPEQATGDDGMARFAFVIATTPQETSFTLHFALPEFYNQDGSPVAFDVPVVVLDSANRAGAILSGQSQVGVQGQQLPTSMIYRVNLSLFNNNPNGVRVTFQNQENGAGMQTSVGTEVFRDTSTPGIIRLSIMPTGDGDAGVTYIPSREGRPELVPVQVIAAAPVLRGDVFATGPQWSRFVETIQDGTRHRLVRVRPGYDLQPLDSQQVIYQSNNAFRIEARIMHDSLPSGPATLTALDMSGNVAQPYDLAIAPQQVSSSMHLVAPSANGDLYLSDPFLATQAAHRPGDSVTVTQGPGGEIMLQLIAGTGVLKVLQDTGQSQNQDAELSPKILIDTVNGVLTAADNTLAQPASLPTVPERYQIGDKFKMKGVKPADVNVVLADAQEQNIRGFPAGKANVATEVTAGEADELTIKMNIPQGPITIEQDTALQEGFPVIVRLTATEAGSFTPKDQGYSTMLVPPQKLVAALYRENHNQLLRLVQKEQGNAQGDLKAAWKWTVSTDRAWIKTSQGGLRVAASDLAIAWVLKNRVKLNASSFVPPNFPNPVTYANSISQDTITGLPFPEMPNQWQEGYYHSFRGMIDFQAHVSDTGFGPNSQATDLGLYLQCIQDAALVYGAIAPEPGGDRPLLGYLSATNTDQIKVVTDALGGNRQSAQLGAANDLFIQLSGTFVKSVAKGGPKVQMVVFDNVPIYIFERLMPAGAAADTTPSVVVLDNVKAE